MPPSEAASTSIENEVAKSRKWVALSIVAGIFAGLWSPLSTYGRAGDRNPDGLADPYSALVLFMIGQILALPLVLWEIDRITNGAWRNPIEVMRQAFKEALALPRSDQIWGVLTGVLLVSGYLFYFLASEVVEKTVAFAISQCAPLVTVLVGVVIFKEAHNSPCLRKFLMGVSATLFAATIAIMALASVYTAS